MGTCKQKTREHFGLVKGDGIKSTPMWEGVNLKRHEKLRVSPSYG